MEKVTRYSFNLGLAGEGFSDEGERGQTPHKCMATQQLARYVLQTTNCESFQWRSSHRMIEMGMSSGLSYAIELECVTSPFCLES